ncbi:MAG: peptidylprolyl isomerase [Gammaproteobacteria bacterium]|tara:strand:+ start:3209 stop:4474 length:1266 start_codon:yes stop_codon:yes gene_type:complete
MYLITSVMKNIFALFFLTIPLIANAANYDDRIIAIVNDKVILKSEVQNVIDNLSPEIISKEYSMLSDQEIINKAIQDLVETSLLIQAADRFGIKISDIALENELQRIASTQNLSINDFRKTVIDQGGNYSKFIDDLRNKMTIETLFVSQFYSRMNVTEEEVENFIKREDINQHGNIEYDLIEFVIEDERKELDKDVINDIYSSILKQGFNNTKVQYDNVNIKIKNIGLVQQDKLPNIFLGALRGKLNDKFTEIITSSKGYHVLNVVDSVNKTSTIVNEYKVRHILLKPNVMTNSEEIKKNLLDIKNEIKDLDDFILFAKKFSEDKGSGYKGGDLGYQRPEALVKEFSDIMKNTPLKKISDPFQSRFGWHILYVENMRSIDDTKSLVRKNVANIIRSNKAKAERDDWVAKLKEQAYIEIKEF